VVDIEDIAELSDGAEPFIEILLKEEELEALAEAAELMKISYSNAKFLQHRAIGILKKLLLT